MGWYLSGSIHEQPGALSGVTAKIRNEVENAMGDIKAQTSWVVLGWQLVQRSGAKPEKAG